MDEPELPKKVRHKVSCSPEECLKALAQLENPTINNLHKYLVEHGHEVSLPWLHQKSRQLNWQKHITQLVRAKRKGGLPDWDLTSIQLDAIGFHANAFTGLRSRVVTKLAKELDELKLTKASDFPVMASFLDHLGRIEHDQKGKDIDLSGNNAGPRQPIEASPATAVSGSTVADLGSFRTRGK